MTHANRLRLDRYGYSHRIAQQRLDAADYIDALEEALRRIVDSGAYPEAAIAAEALDAAS